MCICHLHLFYSIFWDLRIDFLGQLLFYECGFKNIIFASKKVGHAQTESSWGKDIEFKVKNIDAISYHLILDLQRYNQTKVSNQKNG